MFFPTPAPKLDRSLHYRLEEFVRAIGDQSWGFPEKLLYGTGGDSACEGRPYRERRETGLEIELWLPSRLLDRATLDFPVDGDAQARI